MSKKSAEDLRAIANRMLEDYDRVNPGTVFAEGLRLSDADAWQLQTEVTDLREARGEAVVGYKVGAVSPGNQNMMGLKHPVWGRLWRDEIFPSDSTLSKSRFSNLAIEAEFGVTLSRPVIPGMSLDAIAASVDAVYPLLELHNLTFRGEPPHGHELIANNCIFAGAVRGEPVTDLSSDLLTDLTLNFDGELIDSWSGLKWPDDIVASLSWLAESLAKHSLELQTGHFILTSAWGPPIPVGDHSYVSVTSSAFGSASAEFN